MDNREKIMLQIQALQTAGIKNDHPSLVALVGALTEEQTRLVEGAMEDGEDEAPTSMQDAVNQRMSVAAAKKAFKSEDVEDEDESEAMPANVSTESTRPNPDVDVNRISTGDEKVALADLRAMLDPDLSKSALKGEPVAGGDSQTEAMKANVTTLMGPADDASVPTEMLDNLFKTAHGSVFDPKSKVDKAKMAKIQSMLASDPSLADLSPAKFALKLYTSR